MTWWTVAIGVDTHKQWHVAVALDRLGRLIDSLTVDATAADKFEMNEPRITIQFERDQQQSVKGFTLDAGRTRGMIFTRRNGAGKREAR